MLRQMAVSLSISLLVLQDNPFLTLCYYHCHWPDELYLQMIFILSALPHPVPVLNNGFRQSW